VARSGKKGVVLGFHCFRHSFASNLAIKGIDQRLIDLWARSYHFADATALSAPVPGCSRDKHTEGNISAERLKHRVVGNGSHPLLFEGI
jgi:hypothetical protein